MLGSSLSTHLVLTIVTNDGSFLPGTGPLSTLFRQSGGRPKLLPESFLDLDCFQLEIIRMPKRHLGVANISLLQIP